MFAENSSSFDSLACSNVNSAWGALTMEVLARLGVETVVVSPGSRSTPLALAASRNSKLEAIPILDERTAGFFALGLAKRMHKPVALVCTSGSAVVNYYPAVLEASMSGTPLLVLTADRPAELRDCSAGQTIDQAKIFGELVRFFHEVALPDVELGLLAYLRQTLVHAVQQSLLSNSGPVHLNRRGNAACLVDRSPRNAIWVSDQFGRRRCSAASLSEVKNLRNRSRRRVPGRAGRAAVRVSSCA